MIGAALPPSSGLSSTADLRPEVGQRRLTALASVFWEAEARYLPSTRFIRGNSSLRRGTPTAATGLTGDAETARSPFPASGIDLPGSISARTSLSRTRPFPLKESLE